MKVLVETMPLKCCVPMCNSRGGHRFPKDPKRKREWLKAICRDNLFSTESARVCKHHFVAEDYVGDGSGGGPLYLKKGAVPTAFIWASTEIYNDRKDVWRRTKILTQTPRKKRGPRINSEMNKEKMCDAKKEGDSQNSTKRIKKKDTRETNDISDNIAEETLKTDPISDKNSDQMLECRACLQQLKVDKLFSLFQGWAPTWEGLGPTIAEDLANLSNVQLSESDTHSNFICHTCCEKLWNACHFKMLVQDNDRILRQRVSDEREWPKPIQLDKSINGVYENNLPFNIDIKQEVLSDEEASNMEDCYMETNVMEIKVEPEEIVEQAPTIIVNGVTSLKEFPNGEIATQLRNGEMKAHEELLTAVKEEPVSDVEDMELSLDCLLCTRSFHSVTGLKAHVIAQHSYQTVGRKGDASPQRTDKHVCATCRRTFSTPTDLMVHETCHAKLACFSCGARFDAFPPLAAHRARCPPAPAPAARRTLHGVKRPPVEDSRPKEEQCSDREINTVTDVAKDDSKLFSCPLCNEIFTDSYYVKIHQEVHHSKETEEQVETDSAPMEIEALESIFTEGT